MIRYHVPYSTDQIMDEMLSRLSINPFVSYETDETALTDSVRQVMTIDETVKPYFVNSATTALEIMASAMDFKVGDEVILPSYTHVSTANAFLKRGFKLRFADVEPDGMNLDPESVLDCVTKKTRAIIPIHYGGVPAPMEAYRQLDGVSILEDASHGIGASLDGKALGSIGTMGCLSLHATKNITSGGNGGLLFVNAQRLSPIVEEMVFHGTDRSAFLRGEVANYKWTRIGGECEMPAYQRAFLLSALRDLKRVTDARLTIWNCYDTEFKTLEKSGFLRLSQRRSLNGHIFYAILSDTFDRNQFIQYMRAHEIEVTSHYEPLHLTKMGSLYGETVSDMKNTCDAGKQLVRFPIHHKLAMSDIDKIIEKTRLYFFK